MIAEHRPARGLVADQRGGILIFGLFAAALLIGFLYFVVGIGETLHHTERMQDGADTGAYAAAVMHARGMNLIALLNMVQLSTVAITTALLAVMAAVLMTIAWITSDTGRLILYGWTIPFLLVVFAQALGSFNRAGPDAVVILSASERGQRALIEELPGIANERANLIVTSTYAPPVRSAFGWPVRNLAVEAGSPLDLCFRPHNFSENIASEAFGLVPNGTVRGQAIDYAHLLIPGICIIHFVQPMQVASGAQLGGERFQLRTFALGGPLPTLGESGVKTATWRYDEGIGRVGRLRDVLSRVKVAQAEYYFDGPEPQRSMLWHMGWRARMRRVRWPAGTGGLAAECTAHGGDIALCDQLSVRLPRLAPAITH